MAVLKEELHRIIESLNETEQRAVYVFIKKHLVSSEGAESSWYAIDQLEPESIVLTDEEKEQLSGSHEYLSLEESRKLYGF